ncbi:deubiquitinating protein VCPIP1 [Tachyglossus aculeatus]|uniref:deubiquitinating protein VCPIP1 n=1 Tax=Tachyglossus aculeatus TaxID=9261 RepID=UPI0018F68B39|nr:deubiquitinating protein VCPIP1 [Tachyglossus aculeatus]
MTISEAASKTGVGTPTPSSLSGGDRFPRPFAALPHGPRSPAPRPPAKPTPRRTQFPRGAERRGAPAHSPRVWGRSGAGRLRTLPRLRKAFWERTISEAASEEDGGGGLQLPAASAAAATGSPALSPRCLTVLVVPPRALRLNRRPVGLRFPGGRSGAGRLRTLPKRACVSVCLGRRYVRGPRLRKAFWERTISEAASEKEGGDSNSQQPQRRRRRPGGGAARGACALSPRASVWGPPFRSGGNGPGCGRGGRGGSASVNPVGCEGGRRAREEGRGAMSQPPPPPPAGSPAQPRGRGRCPSPARGAAGPEEPPPREEPPPPEPSELPPPPPPGDPPRRSPEAAKVLGLSSYHCKLLAPILARYGLDRATGRARPLRDMNRGELFDCAVLGDRAFLIEPEHVDTAGYGRDRSGSLLYLRDTLEAIRRANRGREALVPVHVDGDGHCLVHAVSRALVGRELFWHALRENLKRHFQQHLARYRALFRDFIAAAEWEDIVSECDPGFVPPEGVPLGLRNVHVFGLANVLRRPIVLLDSLSGMRSSADYSATFLPGLVPAERCAGRDGRLNKPICIAWSSSGRNHYIPLVGVRGAALPRLPGPLLPKAWGVPQDLLPRYIQLEDDGGCVIGGDRGLRDGYLLRLVAAMERVFVDEHGVHPALVADVHRCFYRRAGAVAVRPEEVTAAARRAVAEGRLHRCLACGALSDLPPAPDPPPAPDRPPARARPRPDGGDPGGDAPPPDRGPGGPGGPAAACAWCRGPAVRRVRPDGSVVYLDGDRTGARSAGGRCGCGFKHHWEGREYDNLPEAFPIALEWNGRVVRETVYWFQDESEPALNSNVYDVATRLVTRHFPGEFGSELLVQKVVHTILRQTARRDPDRHATLGGDGARARTAATAPPGRDPESRLPTKIILTGPKTKTLHKEELTASKAERAVQQGVAERAPLLQKRRTEKLRQERGGPAGNASPGLPRDGPSSAPATPTKAPRSPASLKEKKIRITTDDGRQATLTLESSTTFFQLRESIAREFDIPPALQCIRHGFPPKELTAPGGGAENEPVPLQHGDKITIEILKGKEGGGRPATARSAPAGKREDAAVTGKISPRELQEQTDKEMYSLCLLATLMGEDVWSYAKGLPHLFQQGGVFYNIMKKTMGMTDGKHCTFPHLPGKTFVYNATEDRLELCVDTAGHFPIGPDVEDLVKEALSQVRAEATSRSREASPSHGLLKLGSGGVVKKKSEQLHNITAFQGKGHSLGTASSSPHLDQRVRETPVARKHSTGTDFGTSSTKTEASVFTDAPGNSELIRIAPGVVTMRDSRQLDPNLIEAQRKKLQEMVSSIQASMDRHLRDQNTEQPALTDSSQRKAEVSSSAKPGSLLSGLTESFSVTDGTGHPNPEATGGNAASVMGTTFPIRPKAPRENSVEEPEEMDSQDAEMTNTTEPMDHS